MKIVDVPEEGRRFVTLFTIAQKVENCSRKKRNAETKKKEKSKYSLKCKTLIKVVVFLKLPCFSNKGKLLLRLALAQLETEGAVCEEGMH